MKNVSTNMNSRILLLVLIGIGVVYLIVGCNPQPQQQKENHSSDDEVTLPQVEIPQDPDDEHNNDKGWNGVSVGGDRRIVDDNTPIVPDGYLGEKESLEWLSENGYEVVNTKSKFSIKKNKSIDISPSLKGTTNFKYSYELPEGVTVLYQNGKIYISNEK